MTVAHVEKMLGLKEKVRSPLDLVNLGQKGLPKKTVVKLGKFLSVGAGDMAALLFVSRKTVERYSKNLEGHLNHAVSERVLRLAMVAGRCGEVFGDEKLYNEWLKSENTALGGRTPLSLMKSDFGIDMVLNELGRMEYGIIS
jgi:putative toxin-antitoxin system antitoxin component (TIGR02293 family)